MDIFELIKKNEDAPTPESLRALAEAIPGSVKEIKLNQFMIGPHMLLMR